jgi:hypothetical protein
MIRSAGAPCIGAANSSDVGTVPEEPTAPQNWLREWADAEYITREVERDAAAYQEHIDTLTDSPGESSTERPNKRSVSTQLVMATFGIDPDNVPHDELESPETPAFPLATPDDPYGAIATREREAKDQRNRADRQRRLDRWRERVERGDRPPGFAPKL